MEPTKAPPAAQPSQAMAPDDWPSDSVTMAEIATHFNLKETLKDNLRHKLNYRVSKNQRLGGSERAGGKTIRWYSAQLVRDVIRETPELHGESTP